MKKRYLIAIPLIVLATGGSAAGWWVVSRTQDPMQRAQALLAKGNMTGAQIELRKAVRDNPKSAKAHLLLGETHAQLGQAVAAEKELKTARDLGSDPAAIAPMLARAYLQQRKFQELLTEFPPDADPSKTPPELLMERALAQLGLQQRDDAKATIAVAERQSPQNADIAMVAAGVALVQGDDPAAMQEVERAIQLDSHRADAWLLRARLLNAKGDHDGALKSLDAAIAASPHLFPARLERARLLLAAGQDAKAKDDIDVLIADAPNRPEGIYLRAVLEGRAKDYAAADASLAKIVTQLGRFPRGFFSEALVKYNLGQYDLALSAATAYVARIPRDPDGRTLLARIYLAKGQPEEAVTVLRRAMVDGVVNADTYDLLGRAYQSAGRPDQAADSFAKASAMAPQNPAILTHLAWARLAMGESGEAANDLQRSVELQPADSAPAKSEADEALVAAALAVGDLDRAAAALDRLHQTAGDTETVGNLAGLIMIARQDLDGAAAQFADVMRRFPDSVRAKILLARVDLMQDHRAEAERLLTELLAKQPANQLALRMMVGLSLQDGRVSDAVKLAEAAHGAAPEDVQFTIDLADLYIRAGDAAKAQALLEVAQKSRTSLEPRLVMASARAQVALGAPAKAIDLYRSVLAANPTDRDALRGLITQLAAVHDDDGLRGALRMGLKAAPGDPDLLHAITRFELQKSSLAAALTSAAQLEQDPANLPAARVLKGDLLMTAQHFPEAAAAYQAEFAGNPSTELALRTAAALQAAGKLDDAVRLMTAWQAQHPDDVPATIALAELEILTAHRPEAQARLESVLVKQPNNAIVLNDLATLYGDSGDSRALPMARKAYLLAPRPEVADTLGWILTTQGGPDSAAGLLLLKQAAAQLKTNPSVQYHLAVALKRAGQPAEAGAILKTIVSSPVNFAEKADAARLLNQP